jgi:hypothetical protein
LYPFVSFPGSFVYPLVSFPELNLSYTKIGSVAKLGVGRSTALRIRKRYLEEGLQSASFVIG